MNRSEPLWAGTPDVTSMSRALVYNNGTINESLVTDGLCAKRDKRVAVQLLGPDDGDEATDNSRLLELVRNILIG